MRDAREGMALARHRIPLTRPFRVATPDGIECGMMVHAIACLIEAEVKAEGLCQGGGVPKVGMKTHIHRCKAPRHTGGIGNDLELRVPFVVHLIRCPMQTCKGHRTASVPVPAQWCREGGGAGGGEAQHLQTNSAHPKLLQGHCIECPDFPRRCAWQARDIYTAAALKALRMTRRPAHRNRSGRDLVSA